MNPENIAPNTAAGLAGFLGFCALLLLLFHFIGFRALVTVGRAG